MWLNHLTSIPTATYFGRCVSNCWTGIWNCVMKNGMEQWMYTVVANSFNLNCYCTTEASWVSLALPTCFYVQVWYYSYYLINRYLVGVSMSEPHTSGTGLQDAYVCTCVYMRPYTENLNWMNGYKGFHICTRAKKKLTQWNCTPLIYWLEGDWGQAGHRWYHQIMQSSPVRFR